LILREKKLKILSRADEPTSCFQSKRLGREIARRSGHCDFDVPRCTNCTTLLLSRNAGDNMPTPIKDVLVANRGEIAIRVFRACTELGIRTTAIYSWEDRLSIHRYKADRAYQVGTPGEPLGGYLDGEALIDLALRKGVDAIHPGYGFLSENADFAQKVLDAGIVWIGPPPDVMRALGDKVSARRVALAAGVPVIPGTDAIDDVADAEAFIKQHGYPVLIKAAHGGGGRGMRVVREGDNIRTAFEEARGEARSAFASDAVFVERYLDKPRHIEVQLVCDAHGNRVHFGERDCSIQRRHQKVVEIAPAPNLTNETRRKLCDYAIELANAVGYSSVGTVEFLVEGNEVYFIEVNTRIQVEHTITEIVTGYDLIKTMIRVAEGHQLRDREIGIANQASVSMNGHAIQCRITTEDPANNFAPDFGKIVTYRSAAGFGIRLDAGIGGAGAVVQPFYDSMLVKVSASGRSLSDAAQRIGRSLAEFRIRGVKTNIPFLQNVIRHAEFLGGDTHTRFIDETPELFEIPRRKDRGTKAVRALAEITVNGPPGLVARPARPRPLIVPAPPMVDTWEDPPPSPAFEVFAAQGAEGLSKWIREQPRLLVTDTTFRDAHQSLLATRVRTRDLLNVCRQTGHMLPAMFSHEMWGGATFDVCMRFLREDPWERLARMRKRMPGTLFQMLLRGANAVGYTNYPDDVVRRFIAEAADAGVDVFRIFDALNFVPNMELAMEEVARAGKIVEASICYTGDVASPNEDKYTPAYYQGLAHALQERGAHILNIKDMAGLLKPYSARVLIDAIREVSNLPIHLHTHDTSGNGVAMYLMAAEAGVDIVDCAMSSMAGLTSQPSMNAVVTAMASSARCPDLDVAQMQRLADFWELQRELYYPFESGLKACTTDVYYHEIPRGKYSNLRPRAVQLGLGDKWDVVKTRYHEVDAALGRIVKVTPTSKVVADFAMFLVRNELTVEDLFSQSAEGVEFDFPKSVVDFFAGRLGQPHGGFPADLQKIVLRGGEPLTGRAGDHLPDYDWTAARQTLHAMLDRAPTVREELSYALYPTVFSEYAQFIDEFGEVRILETVPFLYGLETGEETVVEIEEGKTLVIRLLAVGELAEDGTRSVYFELNGQPREAVVIDRSAETDVVRRPKADRTVPGQIGASMQGKVLAVNVAVGATVVKGDVLLTTEAMKMETSVTTPIDGVVSSLEVTVGDSVDAGDLVAVVE
jgi:pyruvate carboxylase